jgi:hypothetical protein
MPMPEECRQKGLEIRERRVGGFTESAMRFASRKSSRRRAIQSGGWPVYQCLDQLACDRVGSASWLGSRPTFSPEFRSFYPRLRAIPAGMTRACLSGNRTTYSHSRQPRLSVGCLATGAHLRGGGTGFIPVWRMVSMRKMSVFVSLALALGLAGLAPLHAQETTGAIEGVVRDSGGAVLPGRDRPGGRHRPATSSPSRTAAANIGSRACRRAGTRSRRRSTASPRPTARSTSRWARPPGWSSPWPWRALPRPWR